MRGLVGSVGILGLLFGGYWLAGSTALDRGVAGLAQSLRDDGWTVQISGIDTPGFPARFDLDLTGLELRDPTGSFGWLAPGLQLSAASYLPTSVQAALPGEQTLILPDQRITVNSTDLLANLRVQARPSLPLQNISVTSGPLRLTSDLGWQTTATLALVTLHDPVGAADQFDLTLRVTGLVPPAAVMDLMNADRLLPAEVEKVVVNAALGFDRPLDRFAGQPDPARLTSVDLREAAMVWGDVGLTAAGTLQIDSAGSPEGDIVVTATNWQKLVAMAVSARMLAPGAAPTWERGLAALAQPDGSLRAPIRFQAGFMSLGPIPLGPAPRF